MDAHTQETINRARKAAKYAQLLREQKIPIKTVLQMQTASWTLVEKAVTRNITLDSYTPSDQTILMTVRLMVWLKPRVKRKTHATSQPER